MVKDREFLERIQSEVKKVGGDQCSVRIIDTSKNNGVILTGVTVARGQEQILPTIYLESFYQEFQKGKTAEGIAREILDSLNENKVSTSASIDFRDFARYQGQIIFRLVNTKLNEEFLGTIPSVPVYENLSLIFAIHVKMDGLGNGSVTITNHLMELWDISDVDVLYKLALVNTPNLFPSEFKTMSEVMFETIQDMPEETRKMAMKKIDTVPMYILTNISRCNGAAVMAYPNLLENIAEQLGHDLVILPSSIHEIIILPADDRTDFRKLEEMVREVNDSQVAEEELLSDTVYVYERSTGRVTVPATQKV